MIAAAMREHSARWSAGKLSPALLPAFSACLGYWGWGENAHPAAVIALPLLWVIAPNRWLSGLVLAAYQLALVCYLPALATTWFDSKLIGFALWCALAAISFAVGAICWLPGGPLRAAGSVLLLLLVWLVASVAMAGHPLVAWGFVLPGWHWFGVAASFVFTTVFAATSRLPRARVAQRTTLATILAVTMAIGLLGPRPAHDSGKVAGPVGALSTSWGRYPELGTLEVVERIEKIGRGAQLLAGGEGALETVVFPEGIIGRYDPSVYPVIEREVVQRIRATGQTVVVGADLMIGRGLFQNAAIVLRPDGTSTWLSARQSTPAGQWRPWSSQFHAPSDWMAPSVVTLGGGVKARIMWCHEEFMPILHLLSEAREPHNLVVVMANLWSSDDTRANAVQAQHTEGMARMFAKPWVRAVNGPKPQ